MTYFLIGFDCLLTIAFFFINYSKIEVRICIGFFVDSQLQVVDRFVIVLLLLVVKNAKVEISLKVF